MRTVLLTGATGFIGSRLAKLLHARGDRLRCVVRSEARAQWLRDALGAELIGAELTDSAALTRALAGCDVAYHLAAIYDVGVVKASELEHTNIEGTRAFLTAIEAARTPRAIYVSSTAAFPAVAAGESTDIEASPGPYPSVYHRTKAAAHEIARAAQRRGAPLIIACPAFVYGPGDNGPGGRFLVDLLRGRVPALLTDPAWLSFVHVDDVARGLELLSERGELGETYVFSGEPDTLTGFAQRVVTLGGRKLPLLRFPSFMAQATGVALDAITRITGIRFPITKEGVATTARYRWVYSHARTSAALNWEPRSLEAGLPDTVAWVQSQIKRG
jgi:dihydroflavonol-4-reductase